MALRIQKKKLAALCRNNRIKLLILHGSFVRGRASGRSDIDIGILTEAKVNADDYLNILRDFGDLFGEEFDPVFLNGAEPLISYQVAVHGKPLFEEKRGVFAEFQVQAQARYRDSKKFRDLEKMYIKRAISEAGK
jgi:predicted nucleotidyltransferase